MSKSFIVIAMTVTKATKTAKAGIAQGNHYLANSQNVHWYHT
jgi:hypothetical protein